MTSVLSLRRLLSGNNFFILLVSVLLFQTVGCGSTKPAVTTTTDTDKPPVVVDEPDDPVDETPKDTIITEIVDDPQTDPKSGKQYSLQLAVIAPFNAESYYPSTTALSPEQERFVQFMNGLNMSLQKTDARIDVHIIDSEQEDVISALDRISPDMVLGTYSGSVIKNVARWAKDNETITISPWRSSTSATADNEYFVQINPTLDQYVFALADFVDEQFQDQQIVIVGKDEKTDAKQLQQLADYKKSQGGTPWKEFYLDPQAFEPDEDGEIDWEPLENLFIGNDKTVFVVPHYRDKKWIGEALNKIASVKDRKKLAIVGMANWKDMQQISYSQRIFLDLHIPVYQHVNYQDAEIRYFLRSYLAAYNMLPTSDYAYLGYDLADFVVKHWMEHGKDMMAHIINNPYQLQTTALNIQPIFRGVESVSPDYYQNVNIGIYKYSSDGRLQKVR